MNLEYPHETDNEQGLERLNKRMNSLVRVLTALSKAPDPPSVPPVPESCGPAVHLWSDDRYVYISAPCPAGVTGEADVFVGQGRVFLRVERSDAEEQSAGPPTTRGTCLHE